MSENRRHAAQHAETVPVASTLADRLAEFSKTHIKVVTVPNGTDKIGVPVPFSPQFKAGHDWTEQDIRALNWAYIYKAAGTAPSCLKSGMSDEQKLVALTAHLNGGYQFTDELGGELDYTELQDAADRVLFNRGVEQGVYSGAYSDADNSGSVARKSRVETVQKILTDPELADRYEEPVRNMVATIRGERHEVQKRTGKKAETAAKKITL